MDGPHWYYSLITNPKSAGLFQHELLNLGNVIVCQHMKYRKYAKYDSVYDVIQFVRNMRFSHNCLYEVVRGKLAHKWYADIDIILAEGLEAQPKKLSPVQGTLVPSRRAPSRAATGVDLFSVCEDGVLMEDLPSETESDAKCVMSVSETINVVKEIKRALLVLLPMIKESDILVASSNDNKKHSYHIVLDKWCVANNKEAKALYKRVIQLVSEQYRSAVDHSMYKSVQQFRMYGSHKWESTRVKTFRDDLSSWKSNTEAKDDKHKELLYFSAFLLGNISGCSMLPSFVEEETKTPFEGTDLDLNTKEIKEALELFRDVYSNANCFTYHSHTSRFILLKRKAPSFCTVCQRKHDTENPYLLIVGDKRNVYFDCRRNEGSKKTYLGSLGYVEEDNMEVVSSIDEAPKQISITKEGILSGLVVSKVVEGISLTGEGRKVSVKQNIVYKYAPDYSESTGGVIDINNEERVSPSFKVRDSPRKERDFSSGLKSPPLEVRNSSSGENDSPSFKVRTDSPPSKENPYVEESYETKLTEPIILAPRLRRTVTASNSEAETDKTSPKRKGTVKIKIDKKPVKEALQMGSEVLENNHRKKEKTPKDKENYSYKNFCVEAMKSESRTTRRRKI
jgi:hypothetical protein